MINIYSQSGQVTYGIKYYTVDTENEKNSLPTKDKMGCKCYVIESETWYILNGNGKWVPFVGEDSTADAILNSIKNMSAEQKNQLKEELDIGGGGEVTPASIVNATGQMNEAQKSQTRTNLGIVSNAVMGAVYERLEALEGTTVTVEGTDPTITPADNTIYNCGELTSLTITNPPATGKYSLIFFSGATATVVTGIDNFTPEANKRYRIDVQDGYATFASWPYTPTP